MNNPNPNIRKTEHPINGLFTRRWSPRAMSGESITDAELMSLFEAARWAPSSFNNQPWRFLYAKKGSKDWEHFFQLLAPPNQVWAKNASALVLLVSKDTFDYNNSPDRTHSISAGAAWENFALQGTFSNLVTHAMAGFDSKKAKEVLKIPDGYSVEIMIVVGKHGKKESLPKELQEREFPSARKPLKDLVCEGGWKW